MISTCAIGKYAAKAFSPLAVSRPLSAMASSTTATAAFPSDATLQRRFRSANAREVHPQNAFFPVYVHHVSKIALKHLQSKRSDWLLQQGLENGLRIIPNGTFVLSFPSKKGYDAGKIWTSYDSSRKQHWLSVYRNKLAVRFLLKDHGQTMKKRLHDSQQTETQIFQALDQMISAVNQMDAAANQTTQR